MKRRRKVSNIDCRTRKKRKVVKKWEGEDVIQDISLPDKNYEYSPRLQNTVNVIDTQDQFDQVLLGQVMQCYEFSKYKFAATTLRLLHYGTVLLYNTGKFIIVGAGSEIEARMIATVYLKEIGKIRRRVFEYDKNGKIIDIEFVPISRNIKCNSMKMANSVGKCYFNPDKIFLDEIYKNNPEVSEYEPESFPGLRITGRYASYLIFGGGCCLILGLSDINNAHLAYKELETYINDSFDTKKSYNVVSRYIWDLTNFNKETTVRNVDYFKKNQILSKKNRKKIRSKSGGGGTDKKKKKKKRGRKKKKKKVKNDDNNDRPVNNFEERLNEYYSFGSYVPTDATISTGVCERVRDSIGTSDFNRCVQHVWKKSIFS